MMRTKLAGCGLKGAPWAALALAFTTAMPATAQNAVKEYVRLGGRVIAVENSSLTTIQTTLPSATLNGQYTVPLSQFITGGVAPYTFTNTSVGSGLSVQSGVVTGVPTAITPPGSPLTFPVTVTDSSVPVALTAQPTFSITINLGGGQGLAIVTTTFSDAVVGNSYSANLAASGGTTPYTWSLVAGTSLPPGLNVVNSCGGWCISGTVPGVCTANQGTYSFGLQVTDSATPTANSAAGTFSITVDPNPSTCTSPPPPGSPMVTTPGGLPNAFSGQAYPTTTLAASGGSSSSYTWSLMSGSSLPPGLSLSTGGVITGTVPSGTGTATYVFSIQATDSSGHSGSQQFTINVIPGVSITSSTSINLLSGQGFAITLQAGGGTPPYTFTSTDIPSWMTLSGNTISGTAPSGSANGSFHVKVTDWSTPTAQMSTSTFNYAVASNVVTLVQIPSGNVLAGGSFRIDSDVSGFTVPTSWSISGLGSLAGSQPTGDITYNAPNPAPYDAGTSTITSTYSVYGTSANFYFKVIAGSATVSGPTSITNNETVNLFTASAQHGDSWDSPSDYMILAINPNGNTGTAVASACDIWYQPLTLTVLLADDGGNFPVGNSAILGSGQTLSNSQCSVTANGNLTATLTPVTYGANLSLQLPVTFSAGYTGTKTVFAQDYPDPHITPGTLSISQSGSTDISVSPATASLTAGQTQQFTASVTGESGATTWQVSPAIGSVSSTGLYTAPPQVSAPQNVTVIATSHTVTGQPMTATALVSLNTNTPTDLNLPNLTFTSTNATFEALHNITANSGFTVSGSAQVTLAAKNQLILGPCTNGVDPCFVAGPMTGSGSLTIKIDPNIH